MVESNPEKRYSLSNPEDKTAILTQMSKLRAGNLLHIPLTEVPSQADLAKLAIELNTAGSTESRIYMGVKETELGLVLIAQMSFYADSDE